MATITGSAGNDTLLGTPFDDVIDTGGGVDRVDAGAGDDIVRITGSVPAGSHNLQIIDGNIGYDILDLSGWQGNLIAYDVGGFLGLYQYSGDGHPMWIGYVRGFEEVHLGAGGQSFNAYQDSQDNPAMLQGWTILGSDGNDTIGGSRGYDRIDAGAGADIVGFSGGNDRISLGSGDDYFSVDQVTGYQDHVTIDGGSGIDRFFIGGGVLDAHMRVDLGAGTGQNGTTSFALTGMENIEVDAIDWAAKAGRSIFLAGSADANTIISNGDPDTIMLGRGGDDMLDAYRLHGALTAFGGSGNDMILGGEGSDWINGGGHYAGDSQTDSADDGADHIEGGNGNDHIFGNSQFAVQGAADGADTIYGGAGMDYVNGNAGNDVIHGDDGPDRLYGGGDNDSITGDAGDDHLNGNKGNDTLDGGDGNDEVLGGQGDDWLFGGNGNDDISGGLGDDRLSGGDGFDTLTGNAGTDVFVIGGWGHFTTSGPDAYRVDVIADYADGQDKLALYSAQPTILHPGAAADAASAFALASSKLMAVGDNGVAAVQVGADTYLYFDNFGHGPESAVHLLNVTASTIDASDFVP